MCFVHRAVSDGQDTNGFARLDNLVNGAIDMGLVPVKQVPKLPLRSFRLGRRGAAPREDLK